MKKLTLCPSPSFLSPLHTRLIPIPHPKQAGMEFRPVLNDDSKSKVPWPYAK